MLDGCCCLQRRAVLLSRGGFNHAKQPQPLRHPASAPPSLSKLSPLQSCNNGLGRQPNRAKGTLDEHGIGVVVDACSGDAALDVTTPRPCPPCPHSLCQRQCCTSTSWLGWVLSSTCRHAHHRLRVHRLRGEWPGPVQAAKSGAERTALISSDYARCNHAGLACNMQCSSVPSARLCLCFHSACGIGSALCDNCVLGWWFWWAVTAGEVLCLAWPPV
jgi:hypothetical protein